jgi:hypothetical protein
MDGGGDRAGGAARLTWPVAMSEADLYTMYAKNLGSHQGVRTGCSGSETAMLGGVTTVVSTAVNTVRNWGSKVSHRTGKEFDCSVDWTRIFCSLAFVLRTLRMTLKSGRNSLKTT